VRALRLLASVALLVVLGGGMRADAQLSAQDQALFNAVNALQPERVKDALRNGANIEAKNNLGKTPLALAAGFGETDIVKLLLENHANVEARDNDGNTPLIWAVNLGETDVVKLLLDNHANFEAKTNHGSTPLIVAADTGKADIVKLLLDSHANVEAKDNDGYTPLLWAARVGRADIVELLLEDHANIEARDNDGWTPLMNAAAAEGHADTVKLLREHGASTSAKSDKGATAIDIAVRNLNCDSVLALEHGAQSKTMSCLAAVTAAYQKNPAAEIFSVVAIRTAIEMNPRPDVSEAARQSYVEANVTYRNAQNDADIKSAIALYKDALVKAPWFSDAWYNLSLAQEKLGDYAGGAKSMKTMEPLETGGPNERRDLDRIYTLEAKQKMNDAKQAQQALLDGAADSLRKMVSGYTLYKFFLLHKQDGSLCSPEEASTYPTPCYVYASDQQGLASQDGSPIGAQAVVTTASGDVVLRLGTQQFCMPLNVADYAMGNPVVHWTDRNEPGLTDCNNPPGDVRVLTFAPKALALDGRDSTVQSAVSGTASIVTVKCPDSECRHADIVIYWLKP